MSSRPVRTRTPSQSDSPRFGGGATTAEQTALTEANAYCAERGREFLPTNLTTPASANPWGPTSYSVTFCCLLPGDPALQAAELPVRHRRLLSSGNAKGARQLAPLCAPALAAEAQP